jgi:predicted transposase/invertase (TIGR01784 family)
LEVHFVELPKFKKVQPDYKKPLERWMIFINGASEEVLSMAMKEDPEIKKAKKVLDYLETDDEIIRYYELREKAVHDEVTRITGARKEGIEEAHHSFQTLLMKKL